jgi:hypothetical protein
MSEPADHGATPAGLRLDLLARALRAIRRGRANPRQIERRGQGHHEGAAGDRRAMDKLRGTPGGSVSAKRARLIAEEMKSWGKVAQKANIRIE